MAAKKKKRQITKGRPAVKDSSVILTDANGRPIPKPSRADFKTDLEFFQAFYNWKDTITGIANKAFDETFRKAMRK
jgi:hypothetical protein